MNWLEDIAPVVFSALTGNEMGAAVAAAKGLADIFGWTDNSVEAVKQSASVAPSITPAQKLQLLRLQDNFNLEQDKVDDADVENARFYNSQHVFVDVLASVLILMYIIDLKWHSFFQLDGMRLNVFYGIVVAIIGYYFGYKTLPFKNMVGFINAKKGG